MADKLFIANKRMLDLMAWAVREGIAKNESEYLAMIDFSRTNISNIRTGKYGFTLNQIHKACEITGASADYIFGFQTSRGRRPEKKGIDMLKEAVAVVTEELKRK